MTETRAILGRQATSGDWEQSITRAASYLTCPRSDKKPGHVVPTSLWTMGGKSDESSSMYCCIIGCHNKSPTSDEPGSRWCMDVVLAAAAAAAPSSATSSSESLSSSTWPGKHHKNSGSMYPIRREHDGYIGRRLHRPTVSHTREKVRTRDCSCYSKT